MFQIKKKEKKENLKIHDAFTYIHTHTHVLRILVNK